MNKMKTPETRAEFERALFLLHRRIESGRLEVCRGLSTDGLSRVRELPNGRMDFLSVDEMVRLEANTMAHMDGDYFKKMLETRAGVDEATVSDSDSCSYPKP